MLFGVAAFGIGGCRDYSVQTDDSKNYESTFDVAGEEFEDLKEEFFNLFGKSKTTNKTSMARFWQGVSVLIQLKESAHTLPNG